MTFARFSSRDGGIRYRPCQIVARYPALNSVRVLMLDTHHHINVHPDSIVEAVETEA
jgi:hypothetical protein